MPLPSTSHFNLTALFRDGLLKEVLHILLTTHNPPEDFSTYLQLLQICTLKNGFSQGKNVHSLIAHRRFPYATLTPFQNKLIYMYVKCGSLVDGRKVFDRMKEKDSVSWNTIISAYRRHRCPHEAVRVFHEMQQTGFHPDQHTFASVLPACAKMGALEQGMCIHQSIMDGGFLSDIVVGNALVDMYAKCGSIDKARELFDRMPKRDVISWNAMIGGYAQNGLCEDALKIFESMKCSGTYPDIVSFACVLCACSHGGLVDEGCTYFNHMSNPYCITPIVDHYVCMVDLLGRAGYLEDTLKFIIKIPVKPVVVVWMCFLAACRSHMNIGLGVFTAMLLFDLDPENAVTYVLLSNIYAELGSWGEVQMVRRLMKDRGIKKSPGYSWIEGHKMVHAFCVGDTEELSKVGEIGLGDEGSRVISRFKTFT